MALICLPAFAQGPAHSAKQLFDQERWLELVQLLKDDARGSADLQYYYGVALAHLERWKDARAALLTGERSDPRDKRFPLELAGVAFKQKQYPEAKRLLHRALRLDPDDGYASDFLGTLYFLEANLEAALKYWGKADKPAIADVRSEPALRIRPVLLDHAFAFSPASILTREQFLASQARLDLLEVFSHERFDLSALSDGRFDLAFRAHERNGFGNTVLEGLLRTFGGIFFEEITPEYYNVGGKAANILTLLRFDPDKRRQSAWFSAPLGENPAWRYRVGVDVRNENWTLQTSFSGPSALLGSLNMRREAIAAEITHLQGARWRWNTGLEFSHRGFRNVSAGTALTPQLLSQGNQIKQTARLGFDLWRRPERRLTVSGTIDSQAGRIWSQPGHAFEKLQVSLEGSWLPQARGDNYETRLLLRGGKTLGNAPFDELFMLGVERDDGLWLRAHEGVRHGQKGSAPLGGDYVLSNLEADRTIYSNGFLTAKAGPFLDTGKAWQESSTLGSRKWLFDTGAQLRLRVLGVSVALSYGKDLRSGNNAFFATVKP